MITKRSAAVEAKRIASGEITRYLETGQPAEDHGCADPDPCRECVLIREALEKLSVQLEQPSGVGGLGPYWWQRRPADAELEQA